MPENRAPAITAKPRLNAEPLLALGLLLVLSFLLHRDALSMAPPYDGAPPEAFSIRTASQAVFDAEEKPLPAASLLLSLERSLLGQTPLAYHATSLFWHGLLAWLLFLLVQRMRRDRFAALGAAFAFLLFPSHHQALFTYAGRGEMLGLLCVLACCLLWPSPDEDTKRRLKALRPIAASLLLSLGAAAHSTAYVLPLLLTLAGGEPRFRRRAALAFWPLWLAAASMLVIQIARLGGLGRAFAALSPDPKNTGLALMQTLLFRPGPATPAGLWTEVQASPAQAFALAATLAGLGFALLAGRPGGIAHRLKAGEAARPWVWLLALLPQLLGAQHGAGGLLMASVAPAWIVGGGLGLALGSAATPKRKRAAGGLLAAALAAFCLCGFHRAESDWRQASDLAARLTREFERVVEPGDMTEVRVVNIPERLGAAQGITLALPWLSRSRERELRVIPAGSWDPKTVFALTEAGDGEPWFLYDIERGRLEALERQKALPEALRFLFSGCKGKVTLALRLNFRNGTEREFHDFHDWKAEACTIRNDGSLDIQSSEASLGFPAASRIDFGALDALYLSLHGEAGGASCRVAMAVTDAAAASGFGERRVWLPPFSGDKDLHLGRFHPAFRSLFFRWVGVDRMETTLDSETPGALLAQSPPGPVETLRVRVGRDAKTSLEGAQLRVAFRQTDGAPWREHPQGLLIAPGEGESTAQLQLGGQAGPVGEVRFDIEGGTARDLVRHVELLRPLPVPPIQLDDE